MRLAGVLFGCAVFFLFLSPLWAAEGKAFTIGPADAPKMLYRQGPAPSRSYVEALYTRGGVNVVRDQVPDHIHHHGLMFAIAVNGVDFWAETEGCGKEVSTSFKAGKEGIEEQLDWRDGSGKALLEESRRIRIADLSDGPRILDWESRLTPAAGAVSLHLTGSHYFGMGMRFPESMDKIGAFFNASGAPGELIRGVERNVPADWCAYAVKVADKEVKPH